MTFTLTSKASSIAAAIAACAQAVDSGAKIPILKTVRIAADGSTVTAVATNTDQTILTRFDADGSGVICVDAAMLASKLATLRPDIDVKFDGDDKTVTISQGRSKWKMPIYLDDFPMQVAEPVAGDPVKVGREFIAALKIVSPAVQKGSVNAYAGVWLDGKDVAAADGKQFRAITMAVDLGLHILPPDPVAKIVSMFPNGGDIVISESRAMITAGGLTLITKLFDGKPYPWRAPMAKFRDKAVNSCVVVASELVASIRRAAAIQASGEKSGSFVNMQIRFREDEIEIFTRNHGGEEGFDAVPCHDRVGGDLDVGINGGTFLTNIETFSDTIRILYGSSPDDQIIIEPVVGDGNFRAIMPRVFA